MAKTKNSSKQKNQSAVKERNIYLFWSVAVPFMLLFLFVLWHYRKGIEYYVKTVFSSETFDTKGNNKHDARNVFLMSLHDDNIFGIDVSQYQGNILWDSVALINDKYPLDFIFIRATMGMKGVDKKFEHNWKQVGRRSKIRGAYHYFRPNENSVKQADNFIKSVQLKPGDLPPVLDIEERPRSQSMDSLRVGLKRWLDKVEDHYKIRPIVYSGDSYFTDFLEKEFKDYTLWIANYNFWVEKPKDHWDFWQFSENGQVKGIKGYVDLNMFNGGMDELERLCVPYR